MKKETIKTTTILKYSIFFIIISALNTTEAFRSLPKTGFIIRTIGVKPSLLGLHSIRSFSQSIKSEKEVWLSADECKIHALFGGAEQPNALPMNTLPQSIDFFEKASLKELEDLLSHYSHLAGGNYYVPFSFYGSDYTGPIDEAECRLFAKVHFFNTVMREKFIYEALEKNDIEIFKKCVDFYE